MECKFQVGDMVVCKQAWYPSDAPPIGDTPEVGRIYEVTGFCARPHEAGNLGLYFAEIKLTKGRSGNIDYCDCYNANHFRPVRKTNIEALRALVIKPKVTT